MDRHVPVTRLRTATRAPAARLGVTASESVQFATNVLDAPGRARPGRLGTVTRDRHNCGKAPGSLRRLRAAALLQPEARGLRCRPAPGPPESSDSA
jgi:hypothetical protein